VAVTEAGQFSEAAADLSLTQQAVSKRVAALEKDLGVRLLARTARGVQLTTHGEAFLPHARELLQAEERAAASVHPGRSALRVDVIGRWLAPAMLLRDFHRAHRRTGLDLVTLFDAGTAIAAVRSGQLAGHRIWMPGIVPGTEWAAFYDDLAAALGLTIDVTGPGFGTEPLLDVLAGSPALATFVGEQTRVLWPGHYDLRRIPLRDPVPVYPHSLVWRHDNPHPALTTLRGFLAARPAGHAAGAAWTPPWAAHTVT
jgi:DNA-binding transcriptional LysR family regulator